MYPVTINNNRSTNAYEREERNMKRLVKTILIAVIGYAVGYGLTAIFGDAGTHMAFVTGMFCAGFPFGWLFLAKHIGDITITGGLIGILFFIFKFSVCVFLGWIILPIELVLSIYETIQELTHSNVTA